MVLDYFPENKSSETEKIGRVLGFEREFLRDKQKSSVFEKRKDMEL